MTSLQYENGKKLIALDLSVIPIRADGSKAPAIESWAPFQKDKAIDYTVKAWCKPDKPASGWGIVCGAVSGNLEVMDFDYPPAIEPWKQVVIALGGEELLKKVALVRTPSEGLHAYYRCPEIEGNQKLAMRIDEHGKTKGIAETRGQGGYVISPYSPANCHPLKRKYELIQGDFSTIPTIDPEDRQLLLDAARSLNEFHKQDRVDLGHQSPATTNDGTKPGDDFNKRATWQEVLGHHDWTLKFRQGDKEGWAKPGKKGKGISATTNYGDADLLYVFSTNAPPFEDQKSYSKFAAYTLLEHGGDYSAAAKQLKSLRYGEQGSHKQSTASTSPHEDAPEFIWGELKPIEQTLLPVPDMPAKMLPSSLERYIDDVSYRMQAPREFAAIGSLVMLASVIGTGCTIRPKQKDDWEVVPNMFGAVVARPGAMKTPALQEAMKPLKRLEALADEANQQKRKEYEADHAIYKGQQENLRGLARSQKGVEDTEKLKKQMIELEEPAKPTGKRYITNDSTTEKLTELLNENPRGLLNFRDELTGWFASLDKPGREGDRAYILEAWDGNGSRMDDRIGRGSVLAKNLCLSILGGIQPTKLQAYLHGAVQGLENDGLIQRFQLMVYPNEKTWRLVDEYPDKEARDIVYALVEKLAGMDFTDYGAIQTDSDKFPYMRFNYDGQQFFNAWLTKLQSKISEEDNEMMHEHLSKYRSLMPSLALIFHLVEVAEGKVKGSVTLEAAQKAAQWCDFLEAHARRIYGLVSDISIKAASCLAAKIAKGEIQEGFTIREVRRKEWSFLTDTNIIRAACEELCDAGWLREQQLDATSTSKGKTVFLINPRAKKSTQQGDDHE
jgi:hypothetical protein